MNIYKLQKINKIIKSSHIINIGLFFFHLLNWRYLAIYLDPVLGCNLRCRSCYFSDDLKRKELKGAFLQEDLMAISDAIFSRALRLQIGCGAEPTLFKHNPELVRLGKKSGIKYISLTTNANLLTEYEINKLLSAGLDELTISTHGIKKETYEYLMPNASYEKLIEVLLQISSLKKKFPNFKLRLNFTINNLNIDELSDLYSVYKNIDFDILQLRALKDIGGDIKSVVVDDLFSQKLQRVIQSLKKESQFRNILFIEPDSFLPDEVSSSETTTESLSYCYISPRSFWQSDFNWRTENFNQYSKRTNYAFKILKIIFKRTK